MDGYGDVATGYTWNDVAMIDGNFKTRYHKTHTLVVNDGSKETQIILSKEQTIISVFVENNVGDTNTNLRFGKNYIFAGNDSSEYSNLLTRCSLAFFDTGFFKMTQVCQGIYVVLRREGYPPTGNG